MTVYNQLKNNHIPSMSSSEGPSMPMVSKMLIDILLSWKAETEKLIKSKTKANVVLTTTE